MDTRTAERNARLQDMTDVVGHFDPSDKVHMAHFTALAAVFGELPAAMLVSQDAAYQAQTPVTRKGLELTDPGQVASHPGWKARNRVVRHGEKARYQVFDFAADTKAGGRIVPMFTRDQTVPAYQQP